MATPYNRYQVSAYDIDPATGLPKGGIPSLGTSKDVGYTDEEHQKIAAELNPSGPTDTLDTSGETALERAQREYYENLNRDKPDEEKIRQDIYSRMKAQVDVIEGEYADIFRQEEQAAQERLAETRATQSRAGLIGSDFGAAQTEKVRQQNLGIRKLSEREKSLRIAEVYGKIDQAVKDEVKAKKAEALGNQKAYIDYLAGKDTKVKESVATLAKGNIPLEDVEKSRYQKMLGAFGGNELLLKAYYNDQKPDETKTKYQYEIKGGKLIAYGVNPETGKLDFLEQDLPKEMSAVEAGKYTEKFAPDGTLLLIPDKIDPSKPLDEQIIQGGNFAKPKDQDINGWDDASTQQRAEAQAWLQNQEDFTAADLEKLKSDPDFFLYALGQASLSY